MGYLLGTESIELRFSPDGVDYLPAGRQHAVDTEAPLYAAASSLAYAVCGRAVLIWPDAPFDVEAAGDDIDDACAGIANPA
ncbi:MAG TPA: hypothetical protein VE441_04265 [Mycobacterium sp.]|nr:hypothetical protein [Mycobacterium sp.]